MTLRAVILGLVGAAAICGVTYLNDNVIRQTFLIGNHLPIAVYGVLMIFLLACNPLLRRLKGRFALSGAEIALALGITLAACAIPGGGLMRTFSPSLVIPHRLAKTEAGWTWKDAGGERHGAVELVPGRMLADVDRENHDTVVDGFTGGLSVGGERIGLGDVPWSAWAPPLSFWLPLIVLLWAGLVALSVVLHRQWADHEHLPYPIATFTDRLLPAEGGGLAPVLKSRMFWVALAGVFLIHMNNYASAWFPEWVRIPLDLNFEGLGTKYPNLHPRHPTIFFTVVAFSYFIATDVSLSLAIGPTIFLLLQAGLAAYGVSVRGGGTFEPNIDKFLTFGAYFGVFLVFLYTGRHYYASVAMRAVGLNRGDEVERESVWAFRVFLACMALIVADLAWLGLDWRIALLYVLGVVLIYTVISRIVAETGCFWVQISFFPCVIILGFLGLRALGPEVLATLFFLSTVLVMIDPRECLMPYVVNSLKLVELRRVKAGKAAPFMGMALLIGLAVAVPVTLYLQYDRGANMADEWATKSVPRAPFEAAMRGRERLVAQEGPGASRSVRGFGRLAEVDPDGGLVVAFAIGLAAALVFAGARLSFPRWPIHPVIFLVWSSWSAFHFAASFFFGWLIKSGVMKYGGTRVYRRLTPLMVGLIAGEMLAGVATILIGAIYYAATGKPPQGFRILPG